MSVAVIQVIRSRDAAGDLVVRLGVPLLDEYLEFLGGRCRPNTVLAVAYDLKVFFTTVNKTPRRVRPADVLEFMTAQRTGREGRLQVVEPDAGAVSARTLRRRLSSVSGLFSRLTSCFRSSSFRAHMADTLSCQFYDALMPMSVSGQGSSGRHAPSVVPDVARIGIDHGEEDANALPVLVYQPIRCPARPESVALVRTAQPVVVGAAVSSSANGEPFAIDVEGEQHRPGISLCSAVHSWNGGGTAAVTAEAPVHEIQHPRPQALMSIALTLG
jgi:hypothetical protein